MALILKRKYTLTARNEKKKQTKKQQAYTLWQMKGEYDRVGN